MCSEFCFGLKLIPSVAANLGTRVSNEMVDLSVAFKQKMFGNISFRFPSASRPDTDLEAIAEEVIEADICNLQKRPLPTLPQEHVLSLTTKNWYQNVDRVEAEDLVRNKSNGYFVIRPSGHTGLAITIWHQTRPFNIPIRRRTDGKYSLGTPKENEQAFSDIDTLIENYENEPLILYSGGSEVGRTVLFKTQMNQSKETFRPKKKFAPGTLRYSLYKHAQASLNAGIKLSAAVKLPPGEELSDWIAVHVVDFFNRINLIYGTISEWCTDSSCPTMSGGPKFEYLWADGHKYKKPTHLPAPQYISLLMDWIEAQINDENIFPVTTDVPFPKTFHSTCQKILTRLFRVFVHVYIHHFDRIVIIGAEPHVNTCYKHFYYFIREFDLVNPKELEPLKEMTQSICKELQ